MVEPPPDLAKAAPPAMASIPSNPAQQRPSAAAAGGPAPDRTDIRPLDIPAALQILIAEVRASFGLPAAPFINASGSSAAGNSAAPETAPQAARVIIEIVLQAMPPEPQQTDAWSAALPRAELVLQSGSQAGINAVSAWRDVPPAAVEMTQQTVALAIAVLSDEINPAWIRPEWLNLQPRLERYRRHRRVLRRMLADPDHTDFEPLPENQPR